MCNICYAEKNNISMTKVGPTLDMCDEHYMEWVQEKLLGEEY
jgi:hypothetical protein